MKKLILLSLLSIIAFPCFGQYESTAKLQEMTFSSGRNSIPSKIPTTLQGSMYLNESFEPITIMTEDDQIEAYGRYNVYQNQFEVKKKFGDQDFMIMDASKDVAIKTLRGMFKHLGFRSEESGYLSGYFEVIEEFENGGMLVKRYQKIFEDAVQPTNSYMSPTPARFSEKITLYYVNPQNEGVEVENSWRSLRRTFKEHKKEIRSFVKEKDVDFDANYTGLAKTLQYIISIDS